MAAPTKRREIDVNNKYDNENSDIDSSNEENINELEDEQGMEIQVDFEGRNPQDPDFHGIKTLLQQLFLKAHVDLSGLTDLIISQNYIGSVVKQALDEVTNDEDEDDDINDVFGITTVVNISERQNVECIKQLRELLIQLAHEHATDSANTMIKNILGNSSATLGLLINERFVNIPAQISVPLMENLILEMKRAAAKKMQFEFSYFILICKIYKTNEENEQKKNIKNKRYGTEEPSVIWSNPEEEIFAEEATCSFEFCVEKESDNGLSGAWTEDDYEFVPYRKVLLFDSSKLQQIIDKIKMQIS